MNKTKKINIIPAISYKLVILKRKVFKINIIININCNIYISLFLFIILPPNYLIKEKISLFLQIYK